jgi:hypothetical protein
MKLLMENWRQYINEGIDPRIQKQIDNLLAIPNLGIAIEKQSLDLYENYLQIKYIEITNAEKQQYKTSSVTKSLSRFKVPEGYVSITPADSSLDGPCLQGFVVVSTRATHGWGPLLYDVALEWASKKSSGLAPDRGTLSKHAKAVWAKYEKRDDVDNEQLDYYLGYEGEIGLQKNIQKLTPDNPKDDCYQAASIEVGGEGGWMNTPFSKLYKKDNNEVMQALESAGRLIIR